MRKEALTNSIQRLARRWPQLTALFLAGVALLTLAAWPTATPVGHGNAAAFISIRVTIHVGKRSNSSCNPGFGVCSIVIGVARSQARSVEATVTPVGSDRMNVVFEANPPDRDRVMEIAEDILLDEAVARKLGFKSVTILRGNYAFDSAKGKFGGATFNIKTTK